MLWPMTTYINQKVYYNLSHKKLYFMLKNDQKYTKYTLFRDIKKYFIHP